MATFVLALLVTLASLAGLGIGVLLGRSAPAGSCGGLACGACSKAGSLGCKTNCKAAP